MFHKVAKPKCSKYQQRAPLSGLDISMPSVGGTYGHRGRQPNTDYARQRHAWSLEKPRNFANEQLDEDDRRRSICTIHQEKRISACTLQDRINNKFEQKVHNYLEALEQRRERLRDLLAKEERVYVYETVDQAQKADDNKLSEMKKRSEELKRAKEEERLELVKQKRIQQYTHRCNELVKPFFSRKSALETQNCNLQQMRENEARRQMEKEIDQMWVEVVRKQDEAFLEREVQEAIIKYNRCRKDMDVLTMQIRAKKMAQARHDALERENFREYRRQAEANQQQEEIETRKKLEKTRQDAEDLRKQIGIQKQFDEQRRREEVALDDAFVKLAKLELEREQSKVSDSRATMKRELDTYRHHLEHMKRVREEEDREMDRVVGMCQAEAQAKQADAICKRRMAMQKLQEECYRERAEQIRMRQEETQRELECVREENEMMRQIFETNRKLHEETKRIRQVKALQYRDDLRKQIDFNYELKTREMQEAEKRLQEGLEEERRLEEAVRSLIEDNITPERQHPFRKAMENFDCKCK